MARWGSFSIAICLVFALALAACREDTTRVEETPVPTAIPAAVAATPGPQASSLTTSPTPRPAAAPTPIQVSLVTPTAISLGGVNGGVPSTDQASLSPTGDELSTVDAVKILTPSIVQVVTETLALGFFNEPIPGTGVGTGIILDKDGSVLTNNHVVAGARQITVTLSNGKSLRAKVLGQDLSSDLAVIRIAADGLVPARLGNSSTLQVGEDVIAIGHALGLPGGPTVSKGVISALGRSINTDAQTTISDLIQTDASINPGNSGGALANSRAEVIGINTAIIQGSQGIGFAIPVDGAKRIAAQLIANGFVTRGFLGITPVSVTPGLAEQLDLATTRGVLVARVIPGSAADAAGLIEGDVIVQMGGEPIDDTGKLSKFLIDHPPGEEIELEFFRGQTATRILITLRERPQG